LLADKETPEIVLEWLRAVTDPHEREMQFATQLDEDFRAIQFHTMGEPAETSVINDFIKLGCMRVNWRMVARKLLKHFTLPVILANQRPPGDWNGAPRLAAPLTWRGPVN
jgi:hypothetical protein